MSQLFFLDDLGCLNKNYYQTQFEYYLLVNCIPTNLYSKTASEIIISSVLIPLIVHDCPSAYLFFETVLQAYSKSVKALQAPAIYTKN